MTPQPFYPGKKCPHTYFIEGWLDPGAGLHALYNRKFSCCHWDSKYDSRWSSTSESLYLLSYPGPNTVLRQFKTVRFLRLPFNLNLASLLCRRAGMAQSVQELTTGRKVRGSNAGEGEIFCTRPDRPWGPPSLLCDGYRISFPGVKRPGCFVEPPPPFPTLAQKSNKKWSYSSIPAEGE